LAPDANSYRYVNNGPTYGRDPTGLWALVGATPNRHAPPTPGALSRSSIKVEKVLGRKLQIVSPGKVFIAQAGEEIETPKVTGMPIEPNEHLTAIYAWLAEQAKKAWQWSFEEAKNKLSAHLAFFSKMSINTVDFWAKVRVSAEEWRNGSWKGVKIDLPLKLPTSIPNHAYGMMEEVWTTAFTALRTSMEKDKLLPMAVYELQYRYRRQLVS
jgi:hypothetical protein